MREHVHRTAEGRAELRAAVPPYQHVRSIGEDISATELLLPEGHRLRPVDVAACAAAGATGADGPPAAARGDRPDRRRDHPGRHGARAGTDPRHQLAHAGGTSREIGCDAQVTEIVVDDPDRLTTALRQAARDADLVILVAGSSAGRDDYTAEVVARAGVLSVHGVAVRPGHPVVLGAVTGEVGTPVMGAPGYPVSAALTFDIFAAPVLAALEGKPHPRNAPPRAPGWLASSPLSSGPTTGCASASVGWKATSSPHRCPEAPECSPPSYAPTACSSCRRESKATTPASRSTLSYCRGLGEIGRTIVAIGSHDLILDMAASWLRAADPLVNPGLLQRGVTRRPRRPARTACAIWRDHTSSIRPTGEYTLPYLDRLFSDGPETAVIRLVHRDQGLLVAPGNPAD